MTYLGIGIGLYIAVLAAFVWAWSRKPRVIVDDTMQEQADALRQQDAQPAVAQSVAHARRAA